MIYLIYNKKFVSTLKYPYIWVLDYLTHRRYIKFNHFYLLITINKIFIKNNNYFINYYYILNIIQFESIIKFLQNFYYIKKLLKLIGVGYKINSIENSQILILTIGYSHKLYIQLPKNIYYIINKENNSIELFSYNKILLTTIIHKLKKLHKNDPYKGKGFKLFDEIFIPKFYKK